MNQYATQKDDPANFRLLKAPLTRIFIYSVLTVLLTQFMSWDASQMPTDEKFSEGSFSEDLQLVLLALSSIILLWISFKFNKYKHLALLYSGLTLTSLVRELDNVFDRLVHSWQYPAYLITIIIVIASWKNRRQLLNQIGGYANTTSFGLFLGGFLTTYVFSRLFGAKTFWYAVMEDKYMRVAKNAAEEGPELYGYFFILLSVIELYLLSSKIKSENPANKEVVTVRADP